ncbi:MAG: SAM-dependent methyltransferase [Opitutales bacterium]
MQSREVVNALRQLAGEAGVLDWEQFTRAALYAPGWGYYRQARRRVGHGRGTDFYTAASLGPLFHRLMAEALRTLVGSAGSARALNVVELGAEPEQAVADCWGRFASFRQARLGAPIEPTGTGEDWALFGNEVLDAQPFRRFRVDGGFWRELGVAVSADGILSEVTLTTTSEAGQAQIPSLPSASTLANGTTLDLALEAERLVGALAARPGLQLLAFLDYGKTLAELLDTSPQGTARAYYQHTLEADLLARPGAQDLTCHVCWDRLETVLREAGWALVQVQRQESFFVTHAQAVLAEVIERAPAAFDAQRQALQAMLSPGHLGAKFQVLWARRSTA